MFDWLFGSKTKSSLKNIETSLAEITRLTKLNLRRMKVMSAALDRLREEVAENTAAVASAEVLISGLAEQLRNAIGDEEALNALVEELDANSARLAAAVTANTPAEDGDGEGDEVIDDEVIDEETDPDAPAA